MASDNPATRTSVTPAAGETGDAYLDLLKKTLTGYLFDESGWGWMQQLVVDGKHVQLPPEYALIHLKPFDRHAREMGKDWPFFGYTMVGLRRLDNLQRCIDDLLARNVPGDLLEAGVWRGGAGIFIKACLRQRGGADRDRTVWLADSFQGMPVPNALDRSLDPNADQSYVKYLAVSQERVETNFRRFGLLDERVRFIKGWFKDSLPSAPVGPLALLRLDADLYESTMDTLVPLAPKVNVGGFIIVDDYNLWPGCKRAVDDYRRDKGITEPMEPIDDSAVYWRVERAVT